MNRDLRLRPVALGDKGDEVRNGCEEDITVKKLEIVLATPYLKHDQNRQKRVGGIR